MPVSPVRLWVPFRSEWNAELHSDQCPYRYSPAPIRWPWMEPRPGHRSRQLIGEFSPAASGVHLGDCWQWHCSHANWPSPAAHQQVGLESQSTPGSKSSVAATLACKSWAATTQCLRPSPVWRMNSASPRFAVKFPRKWSRLSLWSTWCPPHQLEVMTPTADRADDQPKRKRPRDFAAFGNFLNGDVIATASAVSCLAASSLAS